MKLFNFINKSFLSQIFFFSTIIILVLIIGYSIKEGLDYESDNLDVEYHDSPEEIKAQIGDAGYFENSDASFSDDSLFVKDESLFQQANDNYRRYKSSNFIPTYEDSVFLSRMSEISHAKPVTDSSSLLSGFCHFNKMNPYGTEQKCLSIEKDVCASTDCCVLLGGVKCVAGNKNGPLNVANYNNPETKSADHYYFKGKCYGNCPSIRM